MPNAEQIIETLIDALIERHLAVLTAQTNLTYAVDRTADAYREVLLTNTHAAHTRHEYYLEEVEGWKAHLFEMRAAARISLTRAA